MKVKFMSLKLFGLFAAFFYLLQLTFALGNSSLIADRHFVVGALPVNFSKLIF